MTEGFLRLTRKWPEGAAVAALRDIDAVSHKKHRSAYRRINQRFLKFKMFFTETGTRNVYDKNLLLLIVRHAMILAKRSYKKDCGMYRSLS